MIYIGTREEWELHHKLGARIGLAMSPGKAYIHRRYANINSVCVDYSLERECTPVVIPFLNVGLMVGNHKVMGKVGSDDDVRKAPYSSVLTEVLKGAWNGSQSTVCKQYISMHRSDLAREAKGRNLFLPKSVGGMGQVAPADWKYVITNFQRQLAGQLLAKCPKLVPDIRPLPHGREIEIIEDKLIDPLRVIIADDTPIRYKKGPQTDIDLLHGFIPYQKY